MKQYGGILIAHAAIVALGAGAIALFTKQYYIALAVLGAGLLWLGIMALLLYRISKKQQAKMDRVFRENDSAVSLLAGNISIPCAIVDLAGRITWRNNAFASLFDGQDVHDVVPEFDGKNPEGKPEFIYELADVNYEKPVIVRSLPFLSNHLSKEEGIIGVYLNLNQDLVPAIQVRFAAPCTADKIWQLMTMEKWTITYKEDDVREENAKISFKTPGVVKPIQ